MTQSRFQFATSTILLITAFVAIWLGAFMQFEAAIGASTFADRSAQLQFFMLWSPLWMPFVFAAYALGRRAISIWQIIAFALAVAAVHGWIWTLTH